MHPAPFAVAAALALTLAGCAPLRVSSYSDAGADFAGYRTYRWGTTVERSTGDPRLDNNQFFHERLQSQIDRALAVRGFEMSAAGEGDLVLHYDANLHQRVDVAGLDRQYGYCPPGACQPYVSEAGTLTVDITDARTNRLIWRGWAEDTFDGAIDDQRWLEDKIDRAVGRIFERLPRRALATAGAEE